MEAFIYIAIAAVAIAFQFGRERGAREEIRRAYEEREDS